MKRKKKIKKNRSLADLRAWRRFLAFYEDTIEKEKALSALIEAHILFAKELKPLEHKL